MLQDKAQGLLQACFRDEWKTVWGNEEFRERVAQIQNLDDLELVVTFGQHILDQSAEITETRFHAGQ